MSDSILVPTRRWSDEFRGEEDAAIIEAKAKTVRQCAEAVRPSAPFEAAKLDDAASDLETKAQVARRS